MDSRYVREESAWVAYFKGLMHAADARSCIESDNWVPAAVSLYYGIFDLTIVALLASNHNPVVPYRGRRVLFNDAIEQGAPDPYSLIKHREALRFARTALDPQFTRILDRLLNLREFASYRPSMFIRGDYRTVVNVCETPAMEFINDVQNQAAQIEPLFRLFRTFLESQSGDDPGRTHSARSVLLLIQASAVRAIEEFGRYRGERARDIAREIHSVTFSRAI